MTLSAIDRGVQLSTECFDVILQPIKTKDYENSLETV